MTQDCNAPSRQLEVARRHKYLDLEVFALRLLGMSLVVGDPAAAE
jgi:hypothetical protein